MPRPAFPDHPMTAKEFQANTRMLSGISTYTFKERCYRYDEYAVDAKSEDEAWEVWEAGHATFLRQGEEDCEDAEITKVE